MSNRVCNICFKSLPATEEFFHKNPNCVGGIRPVCKSCVNLSATTYRNSSEQRLEKARVRARLYYEENREHCKALSKKRYEENKEELKAKQRAYNKSPIGILNSYLHNILTKFNLTSTQLQDMLDNQVGCCGICNVSLVSPDTSKQYYVDHDHSTGKVRGLLCHNCNAMIGFAEDNPYNLGQAIEYLKKRT